MENYGVGRDVKRQEVGRMISQQAVRSAIHLRLDLINIFFFSTSFVRTTLE